MSPITLMRRFTEDIDRVFSSFGGGMRSRAGEEREMSWMPPVEVRQSRGKLIVRAELPGLNEDDVKVEAAEDGLIIQGERKHEETEEQGGFYRSELSYGRFYRLIPLPESAKIDEAKADFKNGVLEVTVPVPEMQRKSRQIPIEVRGESEPSKQFSSSEKRGKAAGTS
jgi:HSP20 family protein